MGTPKKDGGEGAAAIAAADTGTGEGGSTASKISPAPSQSFPVRTCKDVTVYKWSQESWRTGACSSIKDWERRKERAQ